MTTRAKGKSNQSKTLFWQHHVDNQRCSSLSQLHYCREHALALSTFQYWKRKLKRGEQQENARFYPLTVQAALPRQNRQTSSGLMMHVSNGEVRLDIAEEFSASTLKKLVLVLRQL